MGLASSLSTALTGLNAAETQIDVLGNNLANAQTVGFKSSQVVFATQFLQTLSLGASPTTDNGGTNPRQTGLGVQIAGISPNFNQGTVEISANPSDLAIQGDGFFMVQGAQNESLFTRNGVFKLNSSNQLVNSTGNRLLGYGVDETFSVETTQLTSLTIPLGSEAVAKATENVTLEGTLTAKGDIADVAEVIESGILGNDSIPRPDSSGIGIGSAATPTVGGITVVDSEGGGSHAEGSDYIYRIAYVDNDGHEGPVSVPINVTVPVGNSLADNVITLNNLPDGASQYSQINVYRTAPGGTDLFYLGTSPVSGSFVDDNATPLSSTPLEAANLNGNYTYMVTFYKPGEPESRPSAMVGPQNIVNGRILLTNFPTPPVPPSGGGFPEYEFIRIYRNLSNDPNSFYLLDTIDPGDEYTDSTPDDAISDLDISGNQELNLDGPTIDSNTLLTNVTVREGFDYVNPFVVGTLEFTARKGGRTVGDTEFEITAESTVQDLMSFMSESMGIQTDSGDSQNPIVGSENNIIGESGTLQPGFYISDGAIRFVGNNGVENAIDIDLTSFRLTDESGAITTPGLGFGSVQEAVGQSAVTDFIAYDSLGLPVRMRVTAVLEGRDDTTTTYRWFAESSDNSPRTGYQIGVGTGLISFDGNGNYLTSTNSTVAVDRVGLPSTSPLQFELDFSSISGLAADLATMAASRQDGSPPGVLTSYVIGEDGLIRGVFSNGIARDLGQLLLARFANPQGLDQRGQNLFAQGINTGLPIIGKPSENGLGGVTAGALELSNTDTGKDLVTLVLASTQYRSNARVITATQQLFDELLNIRR